MSARSSTAWLLPLSCGFRAAVGFREIFHLLPECPAIFPLPLATPAMPGVMLWHDRPVAVLDPGRLMNTYAMQAPSRESTATVEGTCTVALAAWEPEVGDVRAGAASTPRIGALLLTHVPERIQVDDDQACAIPEGLAALGNILCSCFEHQGCGPVPIIDLQRLFAPPGVSACSPHEAQRAHSPLPVPRL